MPLTFSRCTLTKLLYDPIQQLGGSADSVDIPIESDFNELSRNAPLPRYSTFCKCKLYCCPSLSYNCKPFSPFSPIDLSAGVMFYALI